MDQNIEKIKVLICVEDPGAGNFILPIAKSFYKNNHKVLFFAKTTAIAHLDHSVVTFENITKETNAQKILLNNDTDLILTGTSEDPFGLSLKLHNYAKELKIPTISVVDGPANAGYRFRGNGNYAFSYAPDYILVSDLYTRSLYLNEGFKENRVKVVGHPHYNNVRQTGANFSSQGINYFRKLLYPNAPKNSQILMFASELSTGLKPDQFLKSHDYTLKGRGSNKERTKIVLEEVLEAINLLEKKPYLVVRLHPKEKIEFFEEYENEIDLFSREKYPLQFVYAADAVVGMTSMLLMEAAILQKPTLSIIPRKTESDWLPSIRMGLTPFVYSKNNIVPFLKKILLRPNNILPNSSKYDLFNNSEEDIKDIILDILRKKNK